MLRTAYYTLKPFVPWQIRMSLRRLHANQIRRERTATWPIDPKAAKMPKGWEGWPDGKRFALVLTHDVESGAGLSRCEQVMEMEKKLGFRSSFNFVPEGSYETPRQVRQLLADNGFEVGVHDYRHDGKLYSSRKAFATKALAINRYLKEWNAVGFRSGFMLRNLDWLHALEMLYDSSTFDTDPFEPQPDGVGTIFPFWVPGPDAAGYVELPYTLPQDSTLFLLFKERTIDIWKRKLDWIAERGGMALLDVHPDYLNFTRGSEAPQTFPSHFYREFLEYAEAKYGGTYWNALPREVAELTKARRQRKDGAPINGCSKPTGRGLRKIWIDLDNTPHVPFFEPIVEELSQRGHRVLLTARDAFQVCDLAEQKGLAYKKIGRHYGKNRLAKVAGLFYRALQLAPFVLREKPELALSHGARSQIIICNILRIPTVLMADYEFAQYPPLMRPTWELVPEVIPDSSLCCSPQRIRKYPGIKEDVYVWRMEFDSKFARDLGLDENSIIVTVRPPATEAHYHNPESEKLFFEFMDRACNEKGVQVVLLPRNGRQAKAIREERPQWFASGKTMIPKSAIDGLNLLWHSDLVVSGGGTMNREAAALGVPVYSIFRGKTGAIDLQLQKEGRLVMIQTPEEVREKIQLRRRVRAPGAIGKPSRALATIVEHIQEIARGPQ